MNNRLFYISTCLCMVVIGISMILFISLKRESSVETDVSDKMQCAHWSVFRSAQLLGIPVSVKSMQILLPFDPKGHSMEQVKVTLEEIGINAEGFIHNWDSLPKIAIPCIAHLHSPDHYVVISGMEPEQGFIHIFDDAGFRIRQTREQFESRWTGYTLCLEKNGSFFHTPLEDQKPRALFDHLILDKGDIAATGMPEEFSYPIHNSGNIPLQIETVRTNCSCIRSEMPDHPLAPGETGHIKLFYTVEPKRGILSQNAIVKTNDPVNPFVELFAYGYTDVEVRMKPHQLYLSRLYANRDSKEYCLFEYTGQWSEFKVDMDTCDLTGIEVVGYRFLNLDEIQFSSMMDVAKENKRIPEKYLKRSKILELTFKPVGDAMESVGGTIQLKTNIPGYEKVSMGISGIISKPIKCFPKVLDLTNKTDRTITLSSSVDKPFCIVKVKNLKGDITFDFKKETYQLEHSLICKRSNAFTHHEIVLECEFENENIIHEVNVSIISDDTRTIAKPQDSPINVHTSL